MGLIKAAAGALGGVLADQWKEYFYCDSLPKDVLMVRGEKRTTGRSSNTKGNDNVISNGSGISVADGQCMIILSDYESPAQIRTVHDYCGTGTGLGGLRGTGRVYL